MKNAMVNGITILIFSLLTVVKVHGQMNPLSWFENLIAMILQIPQIYFLEKSLFISHTLLHKYTRRELPSMRR